MNIEHLTGLRATWAIEPSGSSGESNIASHGIFARQASKSEAVNVKGKDLQNPK